jgi:hypothetical protein
MKKIIAIVALAAFALAANAGSGGYAKCKEEISCQKKACLSKQEGKCPAVGNQKKEGKKS